MRPVATQPILDGVSHPTCLDKAHDLHMSWSCMHGLPSESPPHVPYDLLFCIFHSFSVTCLGIVHWLLSSSSLTLSSLITNLLLNPSRDRLQILYQYNFLGPINSCFLFKNLVFVYSFLVVVTFTYHKVYYFSSSFLTVYA